MTTIPNHPACKECESGTCCEACSTWMKLHDAEILKPISEVYEKFKHFDKIICDPNFIKDAHDEGDYPRLLMYDMWSAVIKTISKR